MNTDRGPEARMHEDTGAKPEFFYGEQAEYTWKQRPDSVRDRKFDTLAIYWEAVAFFSPQLTGDIHPYTPRVSMASPEHAVFETILISCMYVPKLPKSSHSIMFNSTTPIIHGS